jgi:hypothetical protein
MYVNVYMYICTYACTYMYLYTHTHTHIYIYMNGLIQAERIITLDICICMTCVIIM